MDEYRIVWNKNTNRYDLFKNQDYIDSSETFMELALAIEELREKEEEEEESK